MSTAVVQQPQSPPFPVSRRQTRADYRKLAEGPPFYELIDGRLVLVARPHRNHDLVSGALQELLGPFIRRNGGILSREPNLYLDGVEDTYHPDYAYLSPGRTHLYQGDGIYGQPDMVCEIVSPRTERVDRGRKRMVYAAAGVPHLWLISPDPPVQIEEYVLVEGGVYALRTTVTAPDEWEPAALAGWQLHLQDLEAAALVPRVLT